MDSNFRHFCLSTLFLITCYVTVCFSLITDLTIDIKPGVNECLYQFVRAGTSFEVEYQVREFGILSLTCCLRRQDIQKLLVQ